MSPYRWVEHTGELEVELEAPTEEGVFEQGFAAMCEVLAGETSEPLGPRTVRLEAADRAALLADWLGELAYLAESEGLVPERLASLELGERQLAATIEGARGEPPHLVKAATYHRLQLAPSERGWRATVVLDV